jgi:hypothetical protein
MPLHLHLTETGPIGSRSAAASLKPAGTPGLLWRQRAATLPLGADPKHPPRPTGSAVLTRWADDAALDAWLETHGELDGWSVRLEPLRAYGSIAALPDLVPPDARPAEDDEPVIVLTMGHTHLHRLPSFLRASNPAEALARDHPAVQVAAALAWPPRFVGTFSFWRTAREMRDYATGQAAGADAHTAAMRADRAHPFHREAVFARFRPYAERGAWHGHTAPEATVVA